MKKLLVTLLLANLVGCATLTESLGTKEAFAACKTADVVTTSYVLHHGAVEANPFMHAIGFNPYIALSVLLIWLVWTHEKEMPKAGLAIASGISCGAAASNVLLIK